MNRSNLPEPKYTLADGKGQLADPDTLHRVYSRLLELAPLRLNHRIELGKRGLSQDQVAVLADQLKYGSLRASIRSDIAARLITEGLEQRLPNVPGFFVKERNGQRYWTIGGRDGLLIPVRDVRGRIVAIKIRVDLRPDESTDCGKYHWLTSKNKNRGGPGPGAHIHVPLFSGDKSTVRITEGPLKADIATLVTGTLTIALPGVNSWRLAAAILSELGAQRALLAFDADWRDNPHVAHSLLSLTNRLVQEPIA